MRLLLDARAAGGAVAPPAALVLGSVGAGAIGLAFTPFAIAGALPAALAVAAFALVLAALASALGAWAVLRKAS